MRNHKQKQKQKPPDDYKKHQQKIIDWKKSIGWTKQNTEYKH